MLGSLEAEFAGLDNIWAYFSLWYSKLSMKAQNHAQKARKHCATF